MTAANSFPHQPRDFPAAAKTKACLPLDVMRMNIDLSKLCQ